jgi:hypothetical protein
MRSRGAALVILGAILSACRAADPPAAPAAQAVPGAQASVQAAPRAPTESPPAASAALASGPKPGERVRQPELDGYCAEPQRPSAFYYHGGNPAVRVARKDACAPLYLTECEAEGRCYPPRDQEPGMWCCGFPDDQPAAHATR